MSYRRCFLGFKAANFITVVRIWSVGTFYARHCFLMSNFSREEQNLQRRKERRNFRRSQLCIIQKYPVSRLWSCPMSNQTKMSTLRKTKSVLNEAQLDMQTQYQQTCYQKLKDEMAITNFVPNYCHVCNKPCHPSTMKQLYLKKENMSEFYNLSADVHRNKFRSNEFPVQFSKVHQQSYHVHEICTLDEHEYIMACTSCSRHLPRGTSLPRFSIPNYFFPETVPQCIERLSIAELLMVSKVFPRCIIYTLSTTSQSNHRFLKGYLNIKN